MITIIEYVEDRYDCLKWKVYTWYECKDKETAFKKMYALEKSSRYDNMRKYLFGGIKEKNMVLDYRYAHEMEDEAMREEYREWYKEYNTIERFYGSCVYD